MPELMLQPYNEPLCGQFCVAMAANVSAADAIAAVGHKRGTTTAEVREALRRLGVACADRCKRIRYVAGHPILPPRGLLVLRTPAARNWHWMLTWDGQIFDPRGCWPETYTGWKITSALEIYN